MNENTLCSFCAHIHTQPSIFAASIHRIHPLNTPYILPPSLCPISPPLIALPFSLPSNSLPFMPSTSYHSNAIFISALFSLRSPVPLRLLPAVFVHCSPCTEMRWLQQLRHNHQSIYKSIMLSPASTSACMCMRAFMGTPFICLPFPSKSLLFSPLYSILIPLRFVE